MELKLEDENGLVLWLGKGDLVQVPMEVNERTQCRKMLVDALQILDQTIIKYDTFPTASETDEHWQQSPQHLSDCPEPEPRLVSAGQPSMDYLGRDPS